MLIIIIGIALALIGIITGIVMLIIHKIKNDPWSELNTIGSIVLWVSIFLLVAFTVIGVCLSLNVCDKIVILEMKLDNPTQSLEGIITEFEKREIIELKAKLDTYGIFSINYLFKDRINNLYIRIGE